MTPDDLRSIYLALRFYADPANWRNAGLCGVALTDIGKDRGQRAREVLKLFKAPKEQLILGSSSGQEADQ